MEHVNGWCFRGIYKGGLWENDLHVSAQILEHIFITLCSCCSEKKQQHFMPFPYPQPAKPDIPHVSVLFFKCIYD